MLGHVAFLADPGKIPFLSDTLITLVTRTEKYKALIGAANDTTSAGDNTAATGSPDYPDFSRMDEVDEDASMQEAEVASAESSDVEIIHISECRMR